MQETFITVGDKNIGLRMSIRTIRNMKLNDGIDVLGNADSIKEDVILFYVCLLYYSALNYCAKHSIEVDFTKEDAWDWLDEIGIASPQILKAMELFNESMTRDVPKKKTSTPKGMPLKEKPKR